MQAPLPEQLSDAVELANGVRMPWVGLGTWRSADGPDAENAVRIALELGYRHIDTAAVYGNEASVGRGLRASGVPRAEVFVTTKVWNSDQGYESTLRAFDQSLAKLGLEYVDLYLVHWAVVGKYRDTWRALERIYREGRSRAIGVSNFLVHHLQDVMAGAEVVPHVNQVEFHPHLVQPELRRFCREHRIQFEAWSPLMRGTLDEVPLLGEIAARHGRTPAQVVLRWNLQHGVVTIPKSIRRERIAENAKLFDFALTDDELVAIDALDQDRRLGPHPDKVDF